MRRMAAPPDESVKRGPINLAKLIQRRLRRFRFGLAVARRQNHAPMSGSERVAWPVDGAGLEFT